MKLRGLGKARRIAARIRNAFIPHAILLLYHRVAEPESDPQLLCVSREHFAEHLEIIRSLGRTSQIKQLREMFHAHRGRAVGITFDDGYADNLYNAKPILERYDAKATVFVTAGYVGSRREFWYDALEKIFLGNGRLPETLQLTLGASAYLWEFGSGPARVDAFQHWNVSSKEDPTARHAAYRSLCDLLRPLPDEQRQGLIEQLAAWAGVATEARLSHRALSPDELRQLGADGLVEIAAHTVTHPVLSALPVMEQKQEISESKTRLEEMLGQAVSSFAYPFGGRAHYTEASVAAVREAGFEQACSNFPGIARRRTDPWQLPRFLVRDWDGEQFARALENWLDG